MQRAVLLPSCPHCFASSAVLLRLGSLKCASASPVTHREACHVQFDWRLDLLEERGLSLTRFSAPKYVWTEMRTFRENEKLWRKKKEKKMIEWYVHVLGEFWSPVCVVCLFNRAWVVACVCLCVYSCVYSCMHSCVWRRDCEIFLFCASSDVSQPSQATRHKVTGTQVWFDSAHLQAVHGVRDHGVHLHPEVRLRSRETHIHLSSLHRALVCVRCNDKFIIIHL